MTQATETNMEKIKAGVWDIHEGVQNTAEKPKDDVETMDNLMQGTLAKYKYVNQVKQRYLVQKGFEEILDRVRKENDFVGSVVTDEQFHADKAAKDLEFFGVEPASCKPLPETEEFLKFCHETADKDPRLVLAIHYIIEGSNNGALFIAKAVQKSYDLEGTDGTYHLQPYGTAIRQKWGEFAAAFNALEMDDELMKEMVKVGRESFHYMNRINTASYQVPESE